MGLEFIQHTSISKKVRLWSAIFTKKDIFMWMISFPRNLYSSFKVWFNLYSMTVHL